MLGSSICKSISILRAVDSTVFKNGILLLESFLNGREPQSLKIKFSLPPPTCIQRHTPPLPRRPPRACTSSSKSSFNRNKNKDRRKMKSLGEWLVINRFYCILLELQSLFGHQNTKSIVVAQSISQPASNVSVLCYHVHGQLMTNSRSIGPNIKKNLLKPNRTAAELFLQHNSFERLWVRGYRRKPFPFGLCFVHQNKYHTTLYMTNMWVIPRYLQTPPATRSAWSRSMFAKKWTTEGKIQNVSTWRLAMDDCHIFIVVEKKTSFRNHLIGKFQLTFHVYILLFGFNMQKCWGPFTSFNLALPTQRPQRTATHVHLWSQNDDQNGPQHPYE